MIPPVFPSGSETSLVHAPPPNPSEVSAVSQPLAIDLYCGRLLTYSPEARKINLWNGRANSAGLQLRGVPISNSVQRLATSDIGITGHHSRMSEDAVLARSRSLFRSELTLTGNTVVRHARGKRHGRDRLPGANFILKGSKNTVTRKRDENRSCGVTAAGPTVPPSLRCLVESASFAVSIIRFGFTSITFQLREMNASGIAGRSSLCVPI